MENAIDKTYRVVRFLLDKVIGYGAAIAMLSATLLAISEVIQVRFQGRVPGTRRCDLRSRRRVFLYFAVTQAHRSHLRMAAVMDALKEEVTKFLRWYAHIDQRGPALSAVCLVRWPAVERSMMMERTTKAWSSSSGHFNSFCWSHLRS